MFRALLRGGRRSDKGRPIFARPFKHLALAAAFLALHACSSGGSVLLESAKHLYPGRSAAASAPTDPSLRYLRVVANGQVLYVAQGYVDTGPEGDTEVWYSGSGEVIRLRDGRLAGSTGLDTDWRSVRYSQVPPWTLDAEVPGAQSTPIQFSRERDLMPGYIFGIQDAVTRFRIRPPSEHLLTQFEANDLQWFEERATTLPSEHALPPSRFAIAKIDGQARVVYSEQCLTQSFCLSFEQWAPALAPGVLAPLEGS